jgi:hypothetical protein
MTETIKNRIEKIANGVVFTADEFEATAKSPTTVSRVLNDFVVQGYLRKLSKGRFYKPQISKKNIIQYE